MNDTMNDTNPTPPAPTPDPVDLLLAEWNLRIECPPDHVATMWNRVSAALVAEPSPACEIKPPAGVPKKSRWGRVAGGTAALIAASVAIAAGLLVLIRPTTQPADGPQVRAVGDRLEQFAFTAEELHQKQILAEEIQRLYVKPVLARQTESGWVIDEVPTMDEDPLRARPTMLIRCMVMESTTPTDATAENWRVVLQEELITNVEYQHVAAGDQPGDVETWVHLLPDRSLWAECHDDVREEVSVLQPNKPRIVWEDKSSVSVGRRFVVVYQCLDPEDV
jgi:hypothetical protein